MSLLTPAIALFVSIVSLVFFAWRKKVGLRENGFPPGPPALLFLGNVHQLPRAYIWRRLTDWSRQYGGIFSLKIAHGTMVVISNPRIIRDYLERRCQSTSDRPAMKVVDIVTNGLHPALTSGHMFKTMRRAMQLFLTREMCTKHLPIQNAECAQLLYDILKKPEGFLHHVERLSVSIILSTTFGIRSPRFEDNFTAEFINVNEQWEQIVQPGATPPVDLMPFLQYLPERYWGQWKSTCKDIRTKQRDLYFGLRDMCAKRMKDGKRNGCFLETLLERQEKLGLTYEMIGYLGGGCLEGGSGNVKYFMQTAILLLACHPHVQAKAQKEMDDVLGRDRLPVLDDFDKLPYVKAIIAETFRFFTPVPLGLPHCSSTDEMVDGYYIPKGSTILMNYYGLYRDPDLYDLPDRFIPERYLASEFGTKAGADTTGLRYDLHFGSGRRICPGIVFAEHEFKPAIMGLLWAFNLEIGNEKVRDPETPVTHEDFTPGISAGPKSFKCKFTPRSERHAEIIRSEYTQARPIFELFEQELNAEQRAFVDTW